LILELAKNAQLSLSSPKEGKPEIHRKNYPFCLAEGHVLPALELKTHFGHVAAAFDGFTFGALASRKSPEVEEKKGKGAPRPLSSALE